MKKPHLALVTPNTVYGTDEGCGPPRRRRNVELRSREYLTNAEVEKLIAAAGKNRNGHRDATMVLIAYRHGLRAAEVVALRWDAIHFDQGSVHVSRAKNGAPSAHPLTGREVRALRRLHRELLPLINSGRCELLHHQKLISQLTGLERRTARSGRDSIDHGPGAHDDVANACAGALLSAFSAHKRRLLRGAYGYGGGPVTWWDETGQEIDPGTLEPITRTRIRFVTVPESLAPAARGKF